MSLIGTIGLIGWFKGTGPSGFGWTSTAEEVTEGLDLGDKRMLITGCNSGIGKESVRVLAMRGATVFGAARNERKATEACESVDGDTRPIVCELSDPESVRGCAEEVASEDAPLDAVICNAGIMALPELEQVHGYEKQFFVNHIGHFILVTELLETLADDGRVVMLSSHAHHRAPDEGIQFDNLSGERGYDDWTAYGQSKLANVLFARELARRFERRETDRVANAVHPGVINTNLARHLHPLLQGAMKLIEPLVFKSIAQGAATQTHVAAHPDAAEHNGEYFADCNVETSSEAGRDMELAERLWKESERIVAVTLIFISSLCLFACDSDSNPKDAEADSSQHINDISRTDPDSARDSHEPETIPPDTPARDGPPNDGDDEDGANPTEHILACNVDIEPQPTSYVCSDGENGRVSYTSEKERLPAPDDDFEGGPSTVGEIRERFGGTLPEKGNSLTLAERHRPDAPLSRGFAEPGEGALIHFGTIHPRDEYGDSTVKVAALLNYRPVEGVYEHYNDDRSDLLERQEGISGTVSIDSEAELVDITLPAEAFDGPGRYDVGLGWEVDGPVDNPSGWRRIVIYYGGCTPPSHECVVRGTQDEANETERAIAKKYFTAGFVYPGGAHAGEGPLEVRLEEGGRVTVNYSVINYQDPPSRAYALVPTVRDTPLDKRFFAITEPRDNGGVIGHRGSFDIEIPDEPGRYDVEVGVWHSPFLDPGDYSELGLGDVDQTTTSRFGTNDVTYIVEE